LECNIRQARKKTIVGVIGRDYDENVFATMSTTIPFIIDPTVAKAVRAWKVVKLCRDLGIQRIIIEEDALKIVYALWLEGCP
jgi:hypothetical protein